MTSKTLIAGYLGRLDRAAAALDQSRRTDPTEEVREHINRALDQAGTRDDLTVRNVLERLGSPEEIVAAELSAQELPRAIRQQRRRPTVVWLLIGALVALVVLILLPGSRTATVEAVLLLLVPALLLLVVAAAKLAHRL